MTRRRFLAALSSSWKAAFAWSLLPPAALAEQAREGPSALHYRPLRGRSLREIARRKEHHGPGRFVNPVGLDRSGRMLQVLSWKLLHRNPYAEEIVRQRERPLRLDAAAFAARRGLSLTLLKHASLLLHDEGFRMLLDPVFGRPFWFLRDYTPLDFDPVRLPAPDLVLLSHGHFDHLDLASLRGLPPGTTVLCPPGYEALLDEAGLSRRLVLDWYDTWTDGRREVVFLPANHWSMRNPLEGPNRGLWGSFLVRSAAGPAVFLSGDTAYFDGFEQIGADFAIDLAVFNVGAYEPRWFMASSHIDPAETVRAFRELRARKLLVAHWGTFQLGDEPVEDPPRRVAEEMKRAGLDAHFIDWKHGDTVAI